MIDFQEVPRVALCVLKILDRHCSALPSSDGEFFTTCVALSPKDLDGRLCAGVKRFSLDSLAPHTSTISMSPLMAALLTQQFELVGQMQGRGADVRLHNSSKITPLLAACALADPQTIMWCAHHCAQKDWHAPTGCYDPYGSDVPFIRLQHAAPQLAQSVQDMWGNTEHPDHRLRGG